MQVVTDAEVVETNNETNNETVAETPNTLKMKALTNEVYNALLQYLNNKPHNEVRGLIDSLSQSPVIDVILNQPNP